MPLFILFIGIPLIELAIFAQVNDHIGLLNTLVLCFLTAIIGGALIKKQGMQALEAVKYSVSQGGFPAAELFDGFCIVIAGAFLMTPGFLTDTIGFALLVPMFRGLLREHFKKHVDVKMHTSQARGANQHPDDIDGDYSRVDDREKLP